MKERLDTIAIMWTSVQQFMTYPSILILDDDEIWLARHQDGLRRGRFNLYPTTQGSEAIELAKTKLITFGLIDEILKVPPLTSNEEGELQRWQGRGVIRKIREFGLNTNFVFITDAPIILSKGDNRAFVKVVQSLRTTASGVVAVINKDEIEDIESCSVYDSVIDLIERFSSLGLHDLSDFPSNSADIYPNGSRLVIFQNANIFGINIGCQSFDRQTEEHHLTFQPNLGNRSVKPDNYVSFDGANIGGANINSTVHGNQVGVQHNYAPDRNLAEAAAEIQELLAQMEKTYSLTTEVDNQIVAEEVKKQIEARPQLKAKIIAALQSGGVETLKQLCKHPAAEIAIAAFEGWKTVKEDKSG